MESIKNMIECKLIELSKEARSNCNIVLNIDMFNALYHELNDRSTNIDNAMGDIHWISNPQLYGIRIIIDDSVDSITIRQD